jgi:hypothetical protein
MDLTINVSKAKLKPLTEDKTPENDTEK